MDSKKLNYIRISFLPDYSKFKLSDLDGDNVAIFRRRVFDIAGCNNNIKVYLNGAELQIHNFREYCQQVFAAACPELVQQHESWGGDGTEPTETTEATTSATTAATSAKKSKKAHWTSQYIAYYEPNSFWSIAVFGNEMREYQQLSFVNSIFTVEGGTHVDYVLDSLTAPINERVKDFLKKQGVKSVKDLTRAQIKNNLFIIIRSLVVNPSFDSQTKVFLKTPRADLKKNLQFNSDDKLCKQFFKELGSQQQLM